VTIKQGKTGDSQHVQRRIIDGGSGYGAQQEPVAHFGLGEDSRSPVEVTVRWPDGSKSVDMIEIDTMVLFDHPMAEPSAAGPPTPSKETQIMPPPQKGAAGLLKAMMGRKGESSSSKGKAPAMSGMPAPPEPEKNQTGSPSAGCIDFHMCSA
jgi:hypothetical protein